MPNNIVTRFARRTGKSVKEVERLWNDAKEVTADSFGKKEKDFTEKDWKYTVAVLKNILGIEGRISKMTGKKKNLFESFISSEKTFDDFYEEMQTSGEVSFTTPTNSLGITNADLVLSQEDLVSDYEENLEIDKQFEEDDTDYEDPEYDPKYEDPYYDENLDDEYYISEEEYQQAYEDYIEECRNEMLESGKKKEKESDEEDEDEDEVLEEAEEDEAEEDKEEDDDEDDEEDDKKEEKKK